MSHTKTFIFVSIDGMTDPLGQSQVLPYLLGLAKKGNKISIVSCEKKENWNQHHKTIESIVSEAGISWDYCFYKTGKPFLSQLQNYLALKKIVVSKVASTTSASSVTEVTQTILHCRSYLAGLIGLYCKRKFNSGFIFDMRGFWADERIDGKIWSKTNPIGSFLYSYFKKKEKEMLIHSDAIITLTHKAKTIILDWNIGIAETKITVIPCCADLNHFSESNLDKDKLTLLQSNYPQLQNKFVLSYVGSLGTWYMADEMLECFKVLSQKTDAHFLIITKDSKELLHKYAKKHDVSFDKLTIVSSSRADMPYYISLSAASLFFIRPSFSKSASSPTKMGELLSMGIPVITNSGVGDVDKIIHETNCGIVISAFNKKEYQQAISNLLENRNLYLNNTVSTANLYFSLKEGVEKYAAVYNSFI
ncbi:MAG: glycosyltransferase [Burkholderiales bacterium]|nr:glycosyltransferase [Bacteroidia bacterium]